MATRRPCGVCGNTYAENKDGALRKHKCVDALIDVPAVPAAAPDAAACAIGRQRRRYTHKHKCVRLGLAALRPTSALAGRGGVRGTFAQTVARVSDTNTKHEIRNTKYETRTR